MKNPVTLTTGVCCGSAKAMESVAPSDAATPAKPSALRHAMDALALCARRPLESYAQTTVLAACAAVAAEPLARDLVLWTASLPGNAGVWRVLAAGLEWLAFLTVLGQLPVLAAALMWPAVRGATGEKPIAPFVEIVARLAGGAVRRALHGLRVPVALVFAGAAADLVFVGVSYCFWTPVAIAAASGAWLHAWARHALCSVAALEDGTGPRDALISSEAFWRLHTLRLESLLLAWPAAAILGGGLASAALPGFAAPAVLLAALCLVLPAWGASLVYAYRARTESSPSDGSVSICRVVMIVGGFLLGIELLNISLFSCCCCGSLPEGQVTKARQDLDTLAMAARLYESRFKALRGNDLKQLLGTVMQDIPQDPWGFPYHLDSVRGTMSSLGADGLPGGTDQDADIEYRFR